MQTTILQFSQSIFETNATDLQVDPGIMILASGPAKSITQVDTHCLIANFLTCKATIWRGQVLLQNLFRDGFLGVGGRWAFVTQTEPHVIIFESKYFPATSLGVIWTDLVSSS